MSQAALFHFRKILTLHQGVVNHLCFAPEIGQLATCGGDGTIKIIDINKLTQIHTIRSHQNWIDDIQYSTDTLNLFSIGRDEEIRIWNTVDYHCLFQYSTTSFGRHPFSENAHLIATSHNRKSIQIRLAISGKPIAKVLVNTRTIVCSTFSPNNSFFATAHTDGTIKIWSPWSGALLCTFVSDFTGITSLAFSQSLEMIVAGSNEGHLNIWSVGDQRKILTHRICHYKITALQFTSTNQHLIIGDLRGDLFALDLSTNTKVFTDSKHAGGITFIKFCNPLKQLAVGSLDGSVSFYDLQALDTKEEMPSDELLMPELEALISKASPLAISTQASLTVINMASSVRSKKISLPTSTTATSNQNITKDSEEEIIVTKKAPAKEWKTGDAIDEMLNVFGHAHGGMGIVYFVRHRSWQVKLAMKSPLPENSNDSFAIQRFIREATAWISLGVHPNIATCFFVKKVEGIPRIFIEYVENGSLYDWIYKGKLNSIELVLKFAIQFCTGIEYAHRRGVIHRDIKPSNCLISSDNNLKITDLGLAKIAQHPEEPIQRNIESLRKKIRRDITTDNSAMGTPEYMSPEQWESSNDVGPESDIYSFGIMLYEMICERKPFLKAENDGIFKMLQLHSLSEPPNLSHFVKNIPPDLKKVIMRCLQKNITARYQNFNDILFDLKKIYAQVTQKEYVETHGNQKHVSLDTKNNYAISLLELGFSNEADEMLARAKVSYKDNFAIQFNYLLRQWKAHQWSDQKLFDYLKQKTTTEPTNELALFYYCMMLLYTEQYSSCIDLIYKFPKYENSSFLMNILAIALLMKGQSEDALKYLKISSQIMPPGPEILLTYASAFYFNGDQKTAQEIYTNIAVKYPQTYKFNDQQFYSSEYQIMRALFASHYPGLPFIPQEKIKPPQDRAKVKTIALTKNANFLVIGSHKNEISLWDTKEQKYLPYKTQYKNAIEIKTLYAKDSFLVKENTAFYLHHSLKEKATQLCTITEPTQLWGTSPKDTYLYWIDQQNTLHLRNLKTETTSHIASSDVIGSIAFSYQENYFAIGTTEGKLKVYSLPTQDLFMEASHSSAITAIIFLEEGTIITGHKDNLLLTWDLIMSSYSQIFVAPFSHCTQIVPNLQENPQNISKFIAIFEGDHYVFWNNKERHNQTSFHKETHSLTICPYQQKYAVINKDQQIELGLVNYPDMPLLHYIYCKPTLSHEPAIPENDFNILLKEAQEHIDQKLFADAYIAVKEALAIKGFEKSSKALNLLYSIAESGELKNMVDIWFDYFIPEKTASNTDPTYIADKNQLVIPHHHKSLLWDLSTKEIETKSSYIPNDCLKLKWVENNGLSYIALTAEHQFIEYHTQTHTQEMIHVPMRGNYVDFCILQQFFCVLDSTGQFVAMNLTTKEVLFTEEFGRSAKNICEYPPGKNILVVYENFLQIFSLELRTNLRNFKGAKAPIESVAFSPLGRLIAQTNIDGSTCIWNAFTSKITSSLPFNDTICALCFSPNSLYLAIADTRGSINIIDVNTDAIIFHFENVLTAIKSLMFTANSRYLIANSQHENRIAVFEINWDMSFSQLPSQKNAPN